MLGCYQECKNFML